MVERVRDPPVPNPNAKPVWHAFERANIVARRGRIGSYFIDRFANVSRLCRLHSSKDLSRVAGDNDLHTVMFAQRERRGKLGSPKAADLNRMTPSSAWPRCESPDLRIVASHQLRVAAAAPKAITTLLQS
jgi:hypothetical protein